MSAVQQLPLAIVTPTPSETVEGARLVAMRREAGEAAALAWWCERKAETTERRAA
jgi:hypothetical protein